MRCRYVPWVPVTLRSLRKTDSKQISHENETKSQRVDLLCECSREEEQLTIHHFVSPGAVLGSDDRSHLIEQVQVIFLNFSCPVYNHKVSYPLSWIIKYFGRFF